MARVPYADQEDVPEEYRDLIVSSLQPGKKVNVYSAIGTNPEILKGVRDYLGALWGHTGLSDRQRELVILAVVGEKRLPYEWHQHVRIGRSVGISDDEIRALADGDLDGFDDDERAILEYAIAVADRAVDDPLHDAAAEYVDDETIVGTAALAAGYLALGLVIEALGVELEPGDEFVGYDLENG